MKHGQARRVNLLYIPALCFLFVFILYPFTRGIFYSFTNWNGYSAEYGWVGFEQYAAMLSDKRIAKVLVNTLIYGIGSTLLQNVIGLGYALLLDTKLRGTRVVRTIVYMPIIISNLVMGYIWYFVLRFNGGAVNDLLGVFGLEPINWLADRHLAVAAVVAANTFQYVGVAMILYLSGLQSIPQTYYEAAELDGAGAWRRFSGLTLPLLMPSVTISMTVNIIGGLNIFAVIVSLTNGGPGYSTSSLSTMMYQLYFAEQNAGYAAALGNLMFVLAAAFGLATLWLLRRKEVEM
ncbi:carbohydrate ABC transporter permease [Cohnella cellulosilytica]|uniref:Carbohydrate ABC transporter permease n=1 Tax=Cohnella cellulosilytica TaxID=986710 RepID=A0ABW2FDN0_9BACL